MFEAIAETTRRTILDVLRDGEQQTASQITKQVEVRLDRAVSRQTVARHLRVLRDAELVSAVRAGKAFRYGVNTEPLESIYSEWLGRYLPAGGLVADQRDRPPVDETQRAGARTEEPGAHHASPARAETETGETRSGHAPARAPSPVDESPVDESPVEQSTVERPADERPADEAEEQPTGEQPTEPPADGGGSLSIDDRLARLHRRLRQDAEEHAERSTDGPQALPRSRRLPISRR